MDVIVCDTQYSLNCRITYNCFKKYTKKKLFIDIYSLVKKFIAFYIHYDFNLKTYKKDF